MAGAGVRRLVVVDAPSNLGLRPPAQGREPGVRRMPETLRAHGLVERLGAEDGGVVPAPAYDPTWQPGPVTRNRDAIHAYTLALADRIGALLDGGSFPLVVGGDCSILLAGTLALRRRGRVGLVYLDGHLDFRHLGNSPHVEAVAGEDLAIVTGRGDDALADIDGLRPYVRDGDVVAIGNRESLRGTKDIGSTAITVLNLRDIRTIGAADVVERTVERLRAAGPLRTWLHLDADVLDSAVMPAVDSPQRGGLSYEALVTLVRGLLASGVIAGMELTIYDPDLDPDGSIAARFVDTIVAALAA